MAQTDIPNAAEKIGARSKDVPWYSPDLGQKLSVQGRDLFENYSKIPKDEVEDHIRRIRDEAWEVFPYPCIGGFRFLDLAISLSPDYQSILERLKTGNETFLDLGCCFGQELRKLVHDGAPSENLYATDLRPEFFSLGYKLFRDEPTLRSKFIAGDIFDQSPTSPLSSLNGEMDIIYAGSFLHLFGYEGQLNVCKQIVRLLKPQKGSVLLGRQVGDVEAGERVHRTNKTQTMYRHNIESFVRLWEEVGDATGSKWDVSAELTIPEMDWGERDRNSWWRGPGTRLLRFSVFRV